MINKSWLYIALAFMAVGFATLSTTLFLNNTTMIKKNDKDFNVYFSDALVNGVRDLSVIESSTVISFSKTFNTLGDTYVLDYEVTNGSKQYDSDLVMSCKGGNDYISVVNEFDTEETLKALDKRNGKLTLEMVKSYVGEELSFDIECTILANAVERDSIAEPEDAPITAKWVYTDKDDSGDVSTGDIYALYANQNEKFWVIEQDDETVTMLALYGLTSEMSQNVEYQDYYKFSDSAIWEYEPGTRNIDIQVYGSDAKDVVNQYVDVIREGANDSTITGDLITYNQLVNLGCTFNKGESYDYDNDCYSSPYSSLLWGTTPWWTRTEIADEAGNLWVVAKQLAVFKATYSHTETVRPTITINKELLLQSSINSSDAYLFCKNISEEYTYGTYHDNSLEGEFSGIPKYNCSYLMDDVCVDIYDKNGNYLDNVCYYQTFLPI